MNKDERIKVSLALYKMAKVEEKINSIEFIKDEESMETINNLHLAMNALARVIFDDTKLCIKLHEDVKRKG